MLLGTDQYNTFDAFIEKAKRFRTIDELPPELLRLFVQCIEVGERAKKYSHSAAQDIRIAYRDIGMVDSNMEKGGRPVHLAAPHRNIDEVVKGWPDGPKAQRRTASAARLCV